VWESRHDLQHAPKPGEVGRVVYDEVSTKAVEHECELRRRRRRRRLQDDFGEHWCRRDLATLLVETSQLAAPPDERSVVDATRRCEVGGRHAGAVALSDQPAPTSCSGCAGYRASLENRSPGGEVMGRCLGGVDTIQAGAVFDLGRRSIHVPMPWSGCSPRSRASAGPTFCSRSRHFQISPQGTPPHGEWR
jgi:hypothetical protein